MNSESEYLLQNAMLASKLTKRLDDALSYHGISFTEFLIMHHLNGAVLKTMRRIELAETVGLSASGVTRLVAPMEKNHIVQKEINPRDARQSLVKLSDTGGQLYEEAANSFDHCEQDILAPLTTNQLQQLMELTSKLKV